jgi:hypothetical protein
MPHFLLFESFQEYSQTFFYSVNEHTSKGFPQIWNLDPEKIKVVEFYDIKKKKISNKKIKKKIMVFELWRLVQWRKHERLVLECKSYYIYTTSTTFPLILSVSKKTSPKTPKFVSFSPSNL